MAVSPRISVLASTAALVLLIAPDVARAQNHRNCAWPIELSPEGYGNYLAPEYVARYWLMPFDTQVGTMTIKGTYPHARYFSFVVYDTADRDHHTTSATGLHDAGIVPDEGSNPFLTPGGANGTYTVVVSRGHEPGDAIAGRNRLTVNSDFGWVMLRVYVPTPDPSLPGHGLAGNVPLPTVALDGAPALDLCSPVNSLADTRAALEKMFPGLDQIPKPPSSERLGRLWFAAPKNPPMSLMPNPDNKYVGMFPGEYEPGRIIVIHGRAPGFPGTYDGSPIGSPARGFRTVDMRFWSICNNDLALPVPAVDCVADLTADLEGHDYTVVVSDDLRRPAWLRPNVNWLPWGDDQYPKLFFFRNMLPAPGFPFAIQNVIGAAEHRPECTFPFDLLAIPMFDTDEFWDAAQCAREVMGDYYPAAAWCEKSKFVAGGWQACIDEDRRRAR